MNIERRTGLGCEFAVAMKSGLWVAFVKFCQDLHESFLLSWCSGILFGELSVFSATSNVAYSDRVLVVPRAVYARDGLIQALMDGAVEVYQIVISDVGPVIVLDVHTSDIFDSLDSAFGRSCAVADNPIYLSHWFPPSSIVSNLDFSSANLV